MKNDVKEFYAGKGDKGSDLTLSFILKDDQEVKLKISRDIAINMIETLYLALDTKGLHRPKDTH